MEYREFKSYVFRALELHSNNEIPLPIDELTKILANDFNINMDRKAQSNLLKVLQEINETTSMCGNKSSCGSLPPGWVPK